MSRFKTESNFTSEDVNPCIDESKLSAKCLDDNDYDYNKCSEYFLNYNTCKKFWAAVKFKRQSQGIQPSMPSKAERQRILEKKKNGVTVISSP